MSLKEKHCKPCEDRNTPPLTQSEALQFVEEINSWNLIDDKKLEKTFLFKDFKEALGFTNKVGEIAESEGHHPDISIFGWNKVKISLFTHSIGGLSENDFIVAAKIDEIIRN